MKKNSNRFEIFVSILSVAFIFLMLYLLIASFLPARRSRETERTTAYRTTNAATTREPSTKALKTYTQQYTYRTTEPSTTKVYTTSYRYRIRHTEPESDPYNADDFRDEEDFYDWYYDDFYDFEDAEDYWREHHND